MRNNKTKAIRKIIPIASCLLLILFIIGYNYQILNVTNFAIGNNSRCKLISCEESAKQSLIQTQNKTGFNVFKTSVYAYNQGRIYIIPPFKQKQYKINKLTDKDINAEALQMLLNPLEAICTTRRRMGRSIDGGWDVCLVGPYELKINNCHVMSFGINNEWFFDDDISKEFNCKILSFDPTMKGVKSHQRDKNIYFVDKGLSGHAHVMPKVGTVATLKQLLTQFKWQDMIIDILKIDIEWSEWDALKTMFEDRVLRNVKQLMLEFHYEKFPPYERVEQAKYTMNELNKLGFLAWTYNWNMRCRVLLKNKNYRRTQCTELYFINKHYLDASHLLFQYSY